MANINSLGGKIRHCRILKGLSQAYMADKLDITHSSYSKIERNYTDPNFTRLEQIAKIFGTSVIDILSVSSKPKARNEWEKIVEGKDKEIMKLQKKVIELLEKKK